MMNKRHNILTGVLALLCAVLVSCSDDLDTAMQSGYVETRAAKTVTPAGLIQQADGTWLSNNCRVPIVGPGRVVNQICASTADIISLGQNQLGSIVDEDITNSCTIPAGIKADVAYTPIVSVKDLYHVYAAGQKVGFVYKDTGKGATVLDLDILNGMTIETYLKGEKQESTYASNETNTLKLDLIAFNTQKGVSDRVLQFTATKPFDEVRMSLTGVKATAASNIALAIKYAFVGENPEIRATSESQFSYFWTGGNPEINKKVGTSAFIDASKIVDDDITNQTSVTSQAGITQKVMVNFKRNIDIGTEIGFCYKTVNVLSLQLLGENAPTITAYDSNNESTNDVSKPNTDVLGLSLIGGSKDKLFASLITTKSCSQIQFQHPKEIATIGGMNVFYAYVREGVKLDPANYFTFGDDVTYDYKYALPQPTTGSVEYIELSHPYGSSPAVEDGKLIGMTKDGAYRVQAIYTAPDGRQVSQIATIYRRTTTAQTGCNNYITAQSNGAYAVEALNKDNKGGCLLCLFNTTNNLNNVVDLSPDNYATASNTLAVGELAPIAAFKMNRPVVPSGTVRAGFIVQADTKFLDVRALGNFKIYLYNGSTLVAGGSTEKEDGVKLSLIGSSNDKIRLNVSTDKEFDRMELWYQSAVGVLTSMRIYNIFYESESCEEAIENGGCMRLMTNLHDNLDIDYDNTKITGAISVGQSVNNLSNLLDDSAETGMSLNSGVSLGGSTFSLKFKKQIANQSVGIIIKGITDIANINLADIGVLKVYNGTDEVASTANWKVVDADLLSHGAYTYIEITPKEEFDRITYTVGGLTLVNATMLTGVYIRPDSDGDGIPDCADTDDNSKNLTLDNSGAHACQGSDLSVPVKGGTFTGNTLVYCYNEGTKKNYSCTGKVEDGKLTVSSSKLPAGQYKLYVYPNNNDGKDNNVLAYDIPATIHPLVTTWKTTTTSTDWNNWDNWTNGSPWTCTNVIIPSGAKIYPVLTSTAKNYCENIHFEAGAEVVGTEHLTMDGMAFVDMAVQGGRNLLLSVPLQETVTGDMFISPGVTWDKSKYFTPLSAGTGAGKYTESRNNPIVYQYFWSGSATEFKEDGSSSDVGGNGWSQDFNAVNTKYAEGQGFLLRAGATTDRNRYIFRFPKTHATYTYYRSNGTATKLTQSISRRSSYVGKLYSPTTIKLTNKEGRVFLMGNPYMAHINVAKLRAKNSNIESVKVSNVSSFDTNKTVESQTTDATLIAPMQGFFIVSKSDTREISIELTSDMLTQKNATTRKR